MYHRALQEGFILEVLSRDNAQLLSAQCSIILGMLSCDKEMAFENSFGLRVAQKI